MNNADRPFAQGLDATFARDRDTPACPRRRWMATMLALGAATLLDGAAGPALADERSAARPAVRGAAALFAYVGSRTTRERNAHGDGISVYRVDAQTGALSLVQVLGGLVNPSFLALSRDGRHLYAVHGDLSDISAMTVDPVTGQLAFLNRQSTQGRNPVHLAIDPTGRFMVVTNHLGSSLAVLPIAGDGSLEPVSQLVRLDGPIGPHRIEQTQSKPHFNAFDPGGRHVIVPDKGLDRIFSFRFAEGRLTPADTPFVVSREGAGPRHVAFAPSGRFAWVVNELDSTVASYRYDPATGALQPFQVLSTLPERFTGNSRASEIVVDPGGRFVYASNRGDDTIAVFAVEPSSGALRFVGAQPTLGRTPRFIAGSPDGRFMYALNEESDTIVVLSVDAANGGLAPTGLVVKSGSPVCMVFSQPG